MRFQSNDIQPKWDPYFYPKFPGFKNSLPLWEKMPLFENWPLIEDYNQMANFTNNPSLRFMVQNSQMDYENEVYTAHQVPTRLYHWHDFFNNLSWLTFPKAKWAMIEQSQREKIAANNHQRSTKQNVLAHFDECGILLCSDQDEFFSSIAEFEWKKNFWDKREALLEHCYPIILGHGILEKCLKPYLGMTAKAIFVKTPSHFFKLTAAQKIALIDENLSHFILSPNFPQTPKNLIPFPLLGWPKWHPANDFASFYDNNDYFRSKPSRINGFDLKTILEISTSY